jgi:endonuclease YncB( thermonuclease family)
MKGPARIRWFPILLLGALGLGYWSDFVPASSKVIASGTVSPKSASMVGRASVIDGDTIEIHGERIRLNGIDAPEAAQSCGDRNGKRYRCGARSADALANPLKASSPTRCDFVERDQYGRFVGDCYRADGASLQAAMVRSGWALDWPRYSGGAFARDQEAARREKLGMWAGEFQPPWEWRAAQRTQTQQPAQIAPLMGSGSSGRCEIKGNISSSGERIYHVPGQQHYAKTKITESKGERWFCTEAEARAAGWRAARR